MSMNGGASSEKILKNPKDLKVGFEIQNNESLLVG